MNERRERTNLSIPYKPLTLPSPSSQKEKKEKPVKALPPAPDRAAFSAFVLSSTLKSKSALTAAYLSTLPSDPGSRPSKKSLNDLLQAHIEKVKGRTGYEWVWRHEGVAPKAKK